MAKKLMMVLAAAVLVGIIATVLAGRTVGAGAFAAAAVLGAMVVVLLRNQQDLRELEAGVPPGEVGDAIREPPPFEPHRRPPRD